MKRFLELLAGCLVFAWGKWLSSEELRPHLYGIAIGILIVAGVEIAYFLIEHRKLLRLYWDSFKPVSQKEIRLTIAYLFRIEVNGRYLLVKSNRIANTYQPVGGVYKYFDPEAVTELREMGALTDNHITNDKVSECDLRLKLQDRRNLPRFLRWFFKKEMREIDPWREFFEELVEPGILPRPVFGYIHASLIGQHFDPIHWDQHFHVNTFKYADVYEPKFVNYEQELAVKELTGTSSPEYLLATEEEIRAGKTSDGTKLIAEHTHKIFHTKKLYK